MKLTPKHMRILDLFTGECVMATKDELAKAAGVSRNTVYRVLREPEAKLIIDEMRRERMGLAQPMVDGVLLNLARAGDVQAIRTIKQMTGEVGSGGTVIHNTMTQTTGDELQDTIKRIQHERLVGVGTKEP